MLTTDLDSAEFDGLIFDMDGTLVDTMPVHYRAWAAELEGHGIQWDEDEFYQLGGTPAVDIARMLGKRAGLELDASAVAISKEHRYLELLTEIPHIESIVEIARKWHGKVPLAVATGAKGFIAEKVLAASGLRELFDVVIAQEQYAMGKPAPDPYLRAAEAIGIEPSRCIVFEDTPTGLQGAEAAGMRCIYVERITTSL